MKQSKSNEQEHAARSAGRPPAGNEPKLQQIAIGKRRRVVVDVMLQIAWGMEYLHSRKIYHGDLNPSNVLVRMRGTPTRTCTSRSPGSGSRGLNGEGKRD